MQISRRFGRVLTIVAIGVVSVSAVVAQETPASNGNLFKYVDMSATELTPGQSKILNKLKSQDTASEVTIVKLAPENLLADSVKLNLMDGTVLDAKKTRIVERANKAFTWSGSVADAPQSAHFSVQEGVGSGTFWAKGASYNLRPLGNGMHVLIKRDTAKASAKEEPEAFKKIEEDATRKEAPKPNPQAEGTPAQKVTVMVVYTPTVAGNHPDVVAFINSVVDITNNCYMSSSVPVRLELVKTEQVPYSESGDVAQDVDNLQGKQDGKIDHIHGLRDVNKADVVVMLIDHADAYGMAAAILANEASAFAVVDDEVADWYFTFAHEIGHLFGCRHNPEADPSTAPFPYGHCLCRADKNWRTIMSYDCGNGIQRIGIWSSPLLVHPNPGGDPAGDIGTHDNCRVLRETAAGIAAFR